MTNHKNSIGQHFFQIIVLSASLLSTNCYAELSLKQELGQQLFFDVNLSKNRTQSCATCHNTATAFMDSRPNAANGSASLGDDNKSLGDRNAPSASYANQIPAFHKNKEGEYVGGLFWDGRANTLKDQAGGPPLNPIEMGMESKQAVLERLKENPAYLSQFPDIYGEMILKSADAAYDAMTDAIAAFEETSQFSPFDSKYDRYLRGEYKMTPQEDLGMTLFFSQQFTNCNQCHQLKRARAPDETFSNYEYHNIGTPVNHALREINGVEHGTRDKGLGGVLGADHSEHDGKFRVPSLRNVAVTGPYMHNGVFKELKTVVAFYNKFNSKSEERQINPETGSKWDAPEIPENISIKELEIGPALDDRRIEALIAFMKTLTDKKYEHLIKN